MSSPALLTFPSDVPFRRQLQPPGARRHPGKLHLGFLAYLLTAHAPRGGRLLDPFAGSGGLLLATLPPWGCDVLLNELEPQWVAQCQAAWAYLQASPAAPRGTAQIVQGDARALQVGGYAGLITSPPYTDALSPNRHADDYHPERQAGHNRGARGDDALRTIRRGYDAVVTSPPYLNALTGQRHKTETYRFANDGPELSAASRHALRQGYAPGERNPAQIGNLAGARYWAAMAAVWATCIPLVRPGGVLVVVLKNIVRGNAEVDLIGGTRAQLEALGCRYVTTHYRAVAPGPFHRIRAKSRPDALVIDREGALVMEVPCP